MERKFFFLFLIIMLGLVGYVSMSKPDLKKLRHEIEIKNKDSEVAHPRSYDSLVTFELNRGISFLENEAVNSEICSNYFPYQKKLLDSEQTQRLLLILNDTSNYIWGETGTPEFDKTIIYYGQNKEVVGCTILSTESGEAKSYPHRSLTKWGSLSPKGHKEIMAAVMP